jgi:hypothetical protein
MSKIQLNAILGLPVANYFDHPAPKTEERKKAHAAVNSACQQAMDTIADNCNDVTSLEYAFMAIQFAKMMADQGITVDELKKEGKEKTVRFNMDSN